MPRAKARAKKKKTGLGHNPLEWIQDTTEEGEESSKLVKVPLDQIVESDLFQLRFELPDVNALAADIKACGQTTPAFVRPLPGGRFELLSGYRRLAAIRKLKGKSILARVFEDLTDEEAERLAISENLQRKDLTDPEQAHICLRLQQRGLAVKDIGRLMGKRPRTVSLYLSVAKAPEPVREALQAGKLTLYVAHELAQACKRRETAYVCSRPEHLEEVIERIVEEEMSVRQVQAYLEQLGMEGQEPTAATDDAAADDDAHEDEQPSPAKKQTRGPFQPVRFSEKKKGGFDLVVKFRRKEDAELIIQKLEETLERVKELAQEEGEAAGEG